MKKTTLLALAAVTAGIAFSETTPAWKPEYPELPRKITSETPTEKEARLAWWRHDRFGMFIHFGLYAAGAKHEWHKNRERMNDEEYQRYFDHFNPDLFDAREWAKAAKAAGMKYMVLTAKHHEGFCLWDTKTTDYKITRTAFGRDLVKEFVEACRAEDLKVGFYFSLMDWHSPDYVIDAPHPLAGRCKWNFKEVDRLNKTRDMARFRPYMFAQVKELLGGAYGKIDIIWFDYTPKHPTHGKTYRDWDAVNLVKLTRQLQPEIIMDNRLDLMDTDDGWDFVTPEQFKAASWPKVRGVEVPWETCQTFSGSWGYSRDEMGWRSPAQLIELLIHSVSHGGNLIMNVGPTARGVFDARANERLAAFGKWMKFNARSIYGCTRAPAEFKAPASTLLTYNPQTNRLYVHLLAYPMEKLNLDPVLFGRIEYAQFLHDASELKLVEARIGHTQDAAAKPAGIVLPTIKPDQEIPVIELFLKQ